MNLATTLAIYGVQTGGEPGRSTLPEDGTNHPETNFDPIQQKKRQQQVGGVVADGFYGIKHGPGWAPDQDPKVKRATPLNKGLRVRDGDLKDDKGSKFGVHKGELQSEGSAPASLPDLYHVVDPVGRLLHKDMGYDEAKKASEARRYAKVIPARRGDSWQNRPIQEDKGKRIPSKIEQKVLDRRSMQTPDYDYTVVR